MNRIYCGDCEIFFDKISTGYTFTVAKGIFIRGDRYECSVCKKVVYGDFGEPFEVGKK